MNDVADDDLESKCFFGSCTTMQDAVDFVYAKTSFDGWNVMVAPFEVKPNEFGFVLHKFWVKES